MNKTSYQLFLGDSYKSLQKMADNSIDCCVTSPPYYNVRDYGMDEQIGREPDINLYILNLVNIFNEVFRVMKPTGTLWINIGDSYASNGGMRMPHKDSIGDKYNQSRNRTKYSKAGGNFELQDTTKFGIGLKNLLGIPWRLAFALQNEGWIVRSEIIWNKPNTLPESVTDRPTKTHETVFFMTKNTNYFYDNSAILQTKLTNEFISKEKVILLDSIKNLRTVWTIDPKKSRNIQHAAMFPDLLVEICIKLGCPKLGTILDPFLGSGTTGIVAIQNDFNFVGCELNLEYFELAKKRIEFTSKKRKRQFF